MIKVAAVGRLNDRYGRTIRRRGVGTGRSPARWERPQVQAQTGHHPLVATAMVSACGATGHRIGATCGNMITQPTTPRR